MPGILRLVTAVIAALVVLGISQVSIPSTVHVDTEVAEPIAPTGG